MTVKLSQAQRKMLERLRGGDTLMWHEATHLSPERVSWVGEYACKGYRRPSCATHWALIQRGLLVIVKDKGDVKFYAAKEPIEGPRS